MRPTSANFQVPASLWEEKCFDNTRNGFVTDWSGCIVRPLLGGCWLAARDYVRDRGRMTPMARRPIECRVNVRCTYDIPMSWRLYP